MNIDFLMLEENLFIKNNFIGLVGLFNYIFLKIFEDLT